MQRLRRLLGRRSARHGERRFVAEGPHLVEEALVAGCVPEVVFAAPGADDDLVRAAADAGAEVLHLRSGVLERVSDAVTPQPIAAVVPFVDRPLADTVGGTRRPALLVVVVGVQDPGNLGTILRVAEASGATGVVCSDGTVDLYSPKTVRASAGALFHVPVAAGGEVTALMASVAGAGIRRYATAANGASDYATVDLRGPVAIVFGNEARGLPDDLPADAVLAIPIAGRSESVNVAMAAAAICFEAARQRRLGC